jgi:hypothetical protein
MKIQRWMMMAVVLAIVITSGSVLAEAGAKPVHCGKGQTLAKALATAQPGDTLVISGTCRERVTVALDRITLDGQGTAVIDGGGGGPAEFAAVVTVDGTSGVVIKGLTIRNGPGEGILGQRRAAFTVQDTKVHDNGSTGISVGGGSTAEVIDTSSQRNSPGLDVYTGSSVILRGAIAISQNFGNGAEINGQAVLEIRGAKVNASDNGGTGIVVGSGQLAIFGFAVSASSTLDASGNGFAGIIVGGSLFTVYPAVTVTASGNGVFGIFLVGPSTIVTIPGIGPTFVVEGNGVGINVGQGAGVLLQGAQLSVKNNGVGLSADGAGTVTILSGGPTPPVISDNSVDIDLKFGTRATFDGVVAGSIACDNTVLSRGTPTCP